MLQVDRTGRRCNKITNGSETKTACARQAVSGNASSLLERSQGRVVVRFVSDFAHQLAVQHLVVFIQHHHGTGGHAGQRAGAQGNTVVLCISADLPFAQARFCGAEGLENVQNLSTLRGTEFLENYGVAIADGPLKGLTARAVVVLDENDNVLHSELVKEIAEEPDYEAALSVLK